MTRLCLVALLGLAACSKSAETPKAAASEDAQFDARWKQATAGGEPLYVEAPKGGGLLGEVRRAVDSPASDGMAAAAIVQGPLPDPEVVSVIRRNLPGVKGCYEVEERAGTVGSGKAIVSLEIVPAGTVSSVSVDAPAFAASKLPACITTRARNWTFPKFTQGPKKFSYPFVFVGG